jgi:hypothetical protein
VLGEFFNEYRNQRGKILDLNVHKSGGKPAFLTSS